MASQLVGDSASFEWQSYVRGHHVYFLEWTPVVGELLTLKREPENPYDRWAVAVMKGEQLVGHIPRSVSQIVSCFLSRDGHRAVCEVIGSRVNRGVQLGVEVPCIYRFYGRLTYINRLKELL